MTSLTFAETYPGGRILLMLGQHQVGEGSPPQRNAWFVWDRSCPRGTDGGLPHPSFRWMDREDSRQGLLL